MSSDQPPSVETNGDINIQDVENLGPLLDRLVDRINDLEDRVDELESGADRDDKLNRVLRYADRISTDGKAVLDYKAVMAAADVSHQTAYSYMDELSSRCEFVEEHTRPNGVETLLVDTTLSTPL